MEDVPSSNQSGKAAKVWAGPLKKRVFKIKFVIKPAYVFFIVFALLTAVILRSFISPILAAVVLSYVTYPVYKWLNTKLGSKTFSAILTIALILLVIAIPAIFAVNALSKEVFVGYLMVKKYLVTGTEAAKCGANAVCGILNAIGFSEPTFVTFFSDSLGKATAAVFNSLTAYLLSLPKIIVNIFISMFLTYYLLKDGSKLTSYVKSILPIKAANQDLFIRRFNDVTFAVVYGNIIVAVIQGLLTSFGFFLLGVPSPLVWGIVTVFTSLIPFLGAYVVWLPTAILLIANGNNLGDGGMVLRGALLIVYGFFMISSVDNILKPKLIGSRANLHPALVLLGVIGGIATFGVIGIIIGPVIIALAASVMEIASKNKAAKNGV